MIFNSLEFAVFLPIVLAVYYVLSTRAQNVWILIASYFFYGWWDARFLLLLIVSTLVNHWCARRIHASDVQTLRKRYLALSVATNLGILGVVKYFDFFAQSFEALLTPLGLAPSMPTLQILLPMGISFYTFQSLSYTIDVYRRDIEPCRELTTFAVYVAYFPQLVAGPIERAQRLLPQLQQNRRVTWVQIQDGLFLILLGLFKKIAIADAFAGLATAAFTQPEHFEALTLLYGLYFFCLQIYCDFSGYSDIARGTSKLLGIELMVNFEQPYFSRSITEFWRRWHISLSTWLRDYLYIPLGGNRHGRLRTYRNLLLTMLLGGLWHGAAWTFVVWGGLHGLFLAIHKVIRERWPAAEQHGFRLRDAVKMFIVFHLVALTWIFFRADSFAQAWQYLTGLLTWQGGADLIGERDFARFAAFVGILLVIDVVQWREGNHVSLLRRRWPVRGFSYAVMLIGIVVSGGLSENVPFIYFQF